MSNVLVKVFINLEYVGRGVKMCTITRFIWGFHRCTHLVYLTYCLCMSHNVRKPDSQLPDQDRHKTGCMVTEEA